MLSSPPPHSTIRLLVRACQEHPARWLAPTAIITVLSFACAQFVYRPEQPASPTLMAQRVPVESLRGESQDRSTTDTVAKLTKAVDLASRQLAACRAQLAVVESSAGEDLDGLRAPSDSPGADSSLQCALANVELALRQAENERQSHQELVSLLETVQAEPGQLAAVPNHALGAQPTLRQLQEELVAARSHTTKLLETMRPVHPSVQASLAVEEEIRPRLQRELGTATGGLRAEQPRLDAHIATLTQESTQLHERLRRLAVFSTDYNRQLAEIRQRTDTLTVAKSELATARDKLAQRRTVTPSSRIESPATSARDMRKVRALIVAAGLVGGWLVGMGILLLTSTRKTAVVSLPVETPLAVMLADQPVVAPAWQPLSPSVAREATRSPRPSGRMRLRDALVRCAEHSNGS